MLFNTMTLGTCYYPEHWEESLWKSDLERMLQNGVRVIRIAEFAWNKFEPEEGVFTFDFFDRFLELAASTEIKVIFCTPTATPPAWAGHTYPEILNARKDGVLTRHGHRRHYNYNSPKYRELTRIIVEKLGEHYGNHPSIIGWQIDNEINCEINEFYSESDSQAFRVFLRRRYGTLEALNRAWGTVFWNQDYTSWDQVFVPRPTVCGESNPHQQLDYIRFISHSARGFVKLQADILRRHVGKEVFITTNGLFGNLDNHRMKEESLDVLMYDSYPNFAFCLGEDPLRSASLNDRKWSRSLAEMRSVNPIFGIMEQQSGPNGWTFRMEAPAPKPGQMTLWTMQSAAHGADFISYFRWRTCTVGTEIYWHGILDYDNRDNRRLEEVAQISQKFAALAPVTGARYKASFAVLRDYDNIWDAQYDAWHRRVEQESQAGWFQAAQLTHTPMDYLYLRENTALEELRQYPLLVYPHATILTEKTGELLRAYVKAGGTLLMGCRTGYKDTQGRCLMQPKPGPASPLCAVDIRDCTFVGPGDGVVRALWDGEALEAAVFNDILTPLPGGEVLARYDSNYYQGEPALVRSRWGKGAAYYFGGAFSRETAAAFLRKLGAAEPYGDIVTLPECCELAVREKDGARYLFLLNYSHREQTVLLHKAVTDLYASAETAGSVTLEAYGTRVYRI